MTPLHPDKCEHGIEAYIGTMYNKDLYLLKSGGVLCIRYGEVQDRYISVDISQIPDILHCGYTCCFQLAQLVRVIVQPRTERNYG